MKAHHLQRPVLQGLLFNRPTSLVPILGYYSIIQSLRTLQDPTAHSLDPPCDRRMKAKTTRGGYEDGLRMGPTTGEIGAQIIRPPCIEDVIHGGRGRLPNELIRHNSDVQNAGHRLGSILCLASRTTRSVPTFPRWRCGYQIPI